MSASATVGPTTLQAIMLSVVLYAAKTNVGESHMKTD